MKNKNLVILIIVVLVTAIFLLSGFLFLSLTRNNKLHLFNFKVQSHISEDLIFDETYDEEFQEIYLKTSAANIEIKNSSTTHLVIHGKKEQLKVDAGEDLRIDYSTKPCKFLCFNIESAKIELYLAKDYSGKIKIANDFGDIEVEEFFNSNIEITSSYGDTSVKIANELSIESDCGDIIVGEANVVNLDNNYGDINVARINKKAVIEDDCGDIEIDDLYLEEDSSINNNLGDVEIKRTNDLNIEADTSLGDKKINNNNHKADITLTINNDCGDIKVN